MKESWSQAKRILHIYELLARDQVVRKTDLVNTFAVNEKTVQRDIDAIRAHFAENEVFSTMDYGRTEVKYSRKDGGYVLDGAIYNWLNHKQILAIARVLLESRAFGKPELDVLLNGLVEQSCPEERKIIRDIIKNESFHYTPARHSECIVQSIWDLGCAVREKRLVEIEYGKEHTKVRIKRLLEPWSVLFSEYYFYLIAYIHDAGHDFPAVYRLDRIVNYRLMDEHFHMNEIGRFEEGEFRKRVQFMTPGQLMKIRFRFWGESLEAVLDRLPTAKVIEQDGDVAVVEAEVYGKGIKMWLLSQAEFLEVLCPQELRDEMKDTIMAMARNYC